MRRAAVFFVVLAVASGLAKAEATRFAGGVVDLSWVEGGALSIRIALDSVPQSPSKTLTWVVTVSALRFKDGVHSWQLHVNPTNASLVVVPNDFLMTQRFTLPQLHVEVTEFEPGRTLSLLIPRSGLIPELVVPGDRVQVHALWIQQEPLVETIVPSSSPTGGGGDASTGRVPVQTVYAVGSPIQQAFSLKDESTGKPLDGASARIALVRVDAGAADGLVDYLYEEPDPESGLVSYEFDTASLAPGTYDLIVWVGPLGAVERERIELVEASP